MTTRKLAAAAGAAILLGLAGCATPGPLHVYSLASATAAVVADTGPAPAGDVPNFLAAGETLTGFAYDPFTDHFFLRLAPGNRIRVVDRPARAVKREFDAAPAPATGGGDLAVRPRDGHLVLTLPGEPALLELTRFGEFVRRFALESPAAGVAFDAVRDRLLILEAGGSRVAIYARDEKVLKRISLARAVANGALGYDSARRELYAPLAGAAAVGVFDESGQLIRTLPFGAEFLDVGPRSFLRMF